jgi:hypothetical protein
MGALMDSAIEDAWLRKATAAAIAAARKIVGDGAVNPAAPVGRLSDVEWGWIFSSSLFGWIMVRGEQAAVEQLDSELTIRAVGYDPNPWDVGAIAAILPDLSETPGIDWTKPLANWTREEMLNFLTAAFVLIRKSTIARDLSGATITRKSSAAQLARQANAAAGGPLMTSVELNDPIGF